MAFWVVASGLSWGQVPVAQLDVLQPAGGKIGETVRVALHGSDLDELHTVHVSDLGVSGSIENGQAVLHLSDTLTPRMVEVAVEGRFGISNTRLFVVGDLSEVVEAGDHASTESAQSLELNQTVNGTASAAAIDWYVHTPASSEAIALEILAEGIDSRMDPTVVVLSANGREIERWRDQQGRDIRVRFRPPSPNEPLYIGVHDFLYDGGQQYFYRLSLGKELPEREIGPRHLVELTLPSVASDPVPYRESLKVEKLPQVVEGTCDDDETASMIVLLGEPTSVVAEIVSERMGDPSDFRLRVDRLSADGAVKTIVEDDDLDDPIGNKRFRWGSRDPVLRFQAEAGVAYRVSWRNQFRSGGRYRLVLRPANPDAVVVAAAEKPKEKGNQLSRWVPALRRGGTAVWELMVWRRDGFAGPVTVKAENLAKGLEAPEVRIPAGAHRGTLTVTAAKEGAINGGPMSLTSSFETGEGIQERSVLGAGLLWTVGDANRERWESRVTQMPMLAVIEAETAPMILRPKTPLLGASLGSKSEMSFEIERLLGQAGNFKVSVQGIPGLKKAPETNFDPKASEVKLNLDLAHNDAAQVKPGLYVVHARAWEGKVRHRANPEAVEKAEARRKAKDDEVAEIEAQLKALESEKSDETAVGSLKAKLEEAKKARDGLGKAAEAAKKRAEPRDLEHALVSTPFEIQIADGPLRLTLPEVIEGAAGKQVPVSIEWERLFDFGGGFSLRLAPGEGNECFAPVESQVGEDVSKTELAVQVAKEVAAGDFPVVLEAKLTFNGRAITMKRTAVLRVGVPTAASF